MNELLAWILRILIRYIIIYTGFDILKIYRNQNPATMLVMEKVSVLLCICISFCFALYSQWGLLCGNGSYCEWRPNTLYTGCLPDDMTALPFICFDSSSYIDLSCTSVQVVNIQSSDLSCSRMSSSFTTPRVVSLEIGDTSYVSVDYKCMFFPLNFTTFCMNFIIIMFNNRTYFPSIIYIKE